MARNGGPESTFDEAVSYQASCRALAGYDIVDPDWAGRRLAAGRYHQAAIT